MHHTTNFIGFFFTHDGNGVILRIARVDDQRFARLFGRRDVGAKTRTLPIQRIALVFRPVVIQTRFARSNHLGMCEHSDQLVIRRLMHVRVIGMRTNRAINMRMRFDDRPNPLPIRNIHADRQGALHLIGAHILQQLG